jgi:hypothetical protein
LPLRQALRDVLATGGAPTLPAAVCDIADDASPWLRYGDGGVNYAHRDQSDCTFQASRSYVVHTCSCVVIFNCCLFFNRCTRNFNHKCPCKLALNFMIEYATATPAAVILSRPGVDFGGGALYALDADAKKRTAAVWTAPGDIAVFVANTIPGSANEFFHGVEKVTPAAGGGETRRLAIGILFNKP